MRQWRPPFHASPIVHKGLIWATFSSQVSHQFINPHFWEKMANFSLCNLNICPNFSSQAPKFWNFQFSRSPFQRQWSAYKPHTSKIQTAHPHLKKKKIECSLPDAISAPLPTGREPFCSLHFVLNQTMHFVLCNGRCMVTWSNNIEWKQICNYGNKNDYDL